MATDTDYMKYITDPISSFKKFATDTCTNTKEDVIAARESGDKYAKELVSSFKTTEAVDTVVSNSASIMGQMVAGGVTLLMCPMTVLSRELGLIRQ